MPVVLVARRDQADAALVDGVVGLAPALPVGDADVAESSEITALILLLAQGTETEKKENIMQSDLCSLCC